jgi:hypothetical protein
MAPMERAARGVCRGVVFENLDVGAKLQSHGIEVGSPSASDNGGWTHGDRNAMKAWE